LKGADLNAKLSNVSYDAIVKSMTGEYQNMINAMRKDYELEDNLPGAIIYCMRLKK
jgi:hypothetical protein